MRDNYLLDLLHMCSKIIPHDTCNDTDTFPYDCD